MNKYLFIAIFILPFQGQDAFALLPLHDRIHEAALLGKTKTVLKLLPEATQEEVNNVAETAAGNGHLKTLKAVMEHKDTKALHPDQEGVNLAADFAVHFGDIKIVHYIFPHLDQEGVNSLLIEAASYDDLNLLDYTTHHTVKGVPHPDQEGVDNAATQAVMNGCSDALIYLTNTTVGPRPNPALIKEVELEIADDNITGDDDDGDAMDQLPSPIENNDLFHQEDLIEMGQEFPAPWKDL